MELPRAFTPLLEPSRYKAFYGGRGGGKSHNYAAVLVHRVAERNQKWLCCREIQKSIAESVHALLGDKIRDSSLGDWYRILDKGIQHRDGSPAFVFSGLRNNPDAIKSTEALDGAWVEEASRASKRSLELLTPTVRMEKSEIWFSWNPELSIDPVDKMFRGGTLPPDSIVRKVGWRDNPWFPEVLRREMEHDREHNPGRWEHVWEGGYKVEWEDVFFDAAALIAMAEDVREPDFVGSLIQSGDRCKWYPNVDPWLEVWEPPVKGAHYALGGDVSEGLPTGDQHSCHVLKRGLEVEQVARFAPTCNEAELGRRMALVGRWYGQHGAAVPVAPESNAMGRATVLAIQESAYPDLYMHNISGGQRHGTKKPGWWTGATTRPLLLADLATAIEERSMIVHGQETLDQLRTFVKKPNGKPEAQDGCHDDEVMGLGITYQLVQRVRPRERRPIDLGETIAHGTNFDPYASSVAAGV